MLLFVLPIILPPRTRVDARGAEEIEEASDGLESFKSWPESTSATLLADDGESLRFEDLRLCGRSSGAMVIVFR
jgi:hypothetical protein